MKNIKFNVFLVTLTLGMVILSGAFGSHAHAALYKFTFTSEVTTNGVDGVEPGDAVMIEVISDNGSDTLVSQQWFGYDAISAKFTAGIYEAEILAPFSFAHLPNFETDENGALSNVLFNDDQYNPPSTDTLNGTENIRLALNAITTSDGTNIFFQPWNYYSTYPNAWTIHYIGSPVPVPSTILLFGVGLLGLVGAIRRQK